jgi:hypothetical protein
MSGFLSRRIHRIRSVHCGSVTYDFDKKNHKNKNIISEEIFMARFRVNIPNEKKAIITNNSPCGIKIYDSQNNNITARAPLENGGSLPFQNPPDSFVEIEWPNHCYATDDFIIKIRCRQNEREDEGEIVVEYDNI